MQSAENRRKERNQFLLRLHHTVILISISASKKIDLMALIRTLKFLLLRSKETGKKSAVFGRLNVQMTNQRNFSKLTRHFHSYRPGNSIENRSQKLSTCL